LKFQVKEVDSSGEVLDSGYEDEYQLEDVEITTSDYVAPVLVPDFQTAWEKMGEDCQVVETYSLSTLKTLQAAVQELINFLGMSPCESSDKVTKTRHILYLSGIFLGNVRVLVSWIFM
jgi:coatomer protein complex subunit gamma